MQQSSLENWVSLALSLTKVKSWTWVCKSTSTDTPGRCTVENKGEVAERVKLEVEARTAKLHQEAGFIICTRCYRFVFSSLPIVVETPFCNCTDPDRERAFTRPDLCTYFSYKEMSPYDTSIELTSSDYERAEELKRIYKVKPASSVILTEMPSGGMPTVTAEGSPSKSKWYDPGVSGGIIEQDEAPGQPEAPGPPFVTEAQYKEALAKALEGKPPNDPDKDNYPE